MGDVNILLYWYVCLFDCV